MATSIDSTSSESDEHDASLRPPPQALIRKELARMGILAVRLIGAPGSGKTELIEATIRHMPGPRKLAVIVVNPAAGRDAERLRSHGAHVEPIDAAISRAAFIWRALQQIPLKGIDLIIIETCGGLAPLEDLGQDATVAAFAVSGGDDKAAEYHAILKISSAVMLTKIDIRPHVKFNEHVFRGDIRAANLAAEIFEVSAVNGTGIHHWIQWLDRTIADKKRRNREENGEQHSPDKYLG